MNTLRALTAFDCAAMQIELALAKERIEELKLALLTIQKKTGRSSSPAHAAYEGTLAGVHNIAICALTSDERRTK